MRIGSLIAPAAAIAAAVTTAAAVSAAPTTHGSTQTPSTIHTLALPQFAASAADRELIEYVVSCALPAGVQVESGGQAGDAHDDRTEWLQRSSRVCSIPAGEGGSGSGDAAVGSPTACGFTYVGPCSLLLDEYVRRDLVPACGAVAVIDRRVRPMPLFADATLGTVPFLLPRSPDDVLHYLAFAPEGDDLVDAVSAAWPALLTAGTSRVSLNLYGPPGHNETVPYDHATASLRANAPEATRLRGRAVPLGLSAFNQPEQGDGYRTPLSTSEGLDISGVELAAMALANQLDGLSLRSLPPAGQAAAVALLALAIFAPWLVWSPWRAAAGAGLAAAYGAGASAAFVHAHLWLPVALPIAVALPAAALVGLVLRFRDVEHQSQRLHAALNRYGRATKPIARLACELDARSATIYVVCMSSDIENYTRRVEGRDPAAARMWLNGYFERVFPIIRAHGGHVIDHAGDSMVCIWLCGSTPCTACVAAVNAARAMHLALNATEPGRPFDADAWPTRMGLHFGPVALGDVGDAQHAEPRVVGDIVNTASRIQSANKLLGTSVLVSDEVAAHLPTHAVRPLGRFMLVGKTHAIGLADPMPPTPELAALYAQALAARSQGGLELARASLDQLLARCPHDGPARFLLSQLAAGGPIVFDSK